MAVAGTLEASALITFDDLGLVALDDVTTQYASKGITFIGITDAGGQTNVEVADSTVFADNNPPSPPFSLSNFYNHDPFSRAHIIRLKFVSPVSGISLMYNGAGALGSTTLFNVYSAAGVLIDSLTVPAATDSNYHPLTIPDANVGYVDVVAPQIGWGHYIDNIQFTPGGASCGGLFTFDDLGLSALGDVTTQYAGRGVTFQGVTDSGGQTNIEVADNTVFSDNVPPSSPFSLSNFYDQNSFLRARIMRLLFTTPASGISLMYNGAGSLGSTTKFNVYNNGGTLIDSLTVAAATDSNYHPLVVPDANVSMLEIVSPQSGWGHYIDNLVFECGPVPPLVIQLDVALSWASQLNARYQVQYSTILNPTTWINFGGVVTGTGSTMTVYDNVAPGSRFYRLIYATTAAVAPSSQKPAATNPAPGTNAKGNSSSDSDITPTRPERPTNGAK
jgi:hypothetical protein